jgi:DUF4097 and DUF4098 domain-containing protein YvlB
MDDNVKQVLQMLQDGTISAQDAEMLIAALRGETKAPPPPPEPPKEETCDKGIFGNIFGEFDKRVPKNIDLDNLGERISSAVSKVAPEKIVKRVQSQLRTASRAGAHWGVAFSQRVKHWTDGDGNRPQNPGGWPEQTESADHEFHLDPEAFVLIENPLGEVKVIGITEGPASITATVSAWAPRQEDLKAALDKINVDIHGTDTRLDIKTSAPDNFHEGVVDFEVKIPQSASVRVATQFGNIETYYVNGRTETVTVTGDIHLHDLGGDVRAESASGDLRVEKVGGSVTVATQSGDIHASEIQRGLTANTASGDVHADHVEGGRVECKSVSGDVHVAHIGATAPLDITVESVSGDAHLEHASGNIAMKAVSGDVDLQETAATRVQTQTVSGDVSVRLREAFSGTMQVNTVSGDVTLALPDGSNVRVVLGTTSGDLRCDHDALDVTATETMWTGQIGTGAGSLNVQTISGDTQIQRA